jgi:hypothetical protein
MPWKAIASPGSKRLLRVCGGVIGWAALIGTVACGFDADYRGGTYLCSDGVCPTGQRCVAGVCHAADGGGDAADAAPVDARADAAHDAPVDGPSPGFDCSAPGALSGDGSASGSTIDRGNQVSALCGGVVQNGPDATYALVVAAGSAVHVSIAGDYLVDAYLIAPCAAAPATPACEGDALAMPGAPLEYTATAAGSQYIVVDSEEAAGSGTYTLTVTVE